MGFLVWSPNRVAFKTFSGTKGIGPILSSSQVVLISDLIEVTLLFICLPRAQGKIGLTLCLVYPPLFLLLFILERIFMEFINMPHKRNSPDSVPPSLGEVCCMFHGEPLPHFKSRDFSPAPNLLPATQHPIRAVRHHRAHTSQCQSNRSI